MRHLVAFALAVVTLVSLAEAAGKTRVRVKFVMNEYKQYFNAAQIATIEKRAAEQLISRLGGEHARFLDFTTQDGSASFVLTVTLRSRLAAERIGAPGEVIFHFTVDGPGLQAKHEFVVFRPADDTAKIPALDVFVEDIKKALSDQAYREQLRPLLLNVPIASSGKVLSGAPGPGWLLPYRHQDICLDYESQLRIHHVIRSGAAVHRPKLAARADSDVGGQILGRPVDAAEFARHLGAVRPDDVKIDSVLVTDFHDLAGCAGEFSR